jgi:hypothetical protein
MLLESGIFGALISAIGNKGKYDTQLQAAQTLTQLFTLDPAKKVHFARLIGAELLDGLLVLRVCYVFNLETCRIMVYSFPL